MEKAGSWRQIGGLLGLEVALKDLVLHTLA